MRPWRYIRSGTAALLVSLFTWVPLMPLLAQTTVTLSSPTSPSAGQAGITNINVTCSGFPTGSIPAANVTVTLRPATSGPPNGTTTATAVTTVVGSTRRVSFTIPGSLGVSSPTAYNVSVAGTTSDGTAFSSGNTAALTINPAASIVSLRPTSAAPGQSAAVSITGLFANYVQGATQARFGAGISVGGGPQGGFGLLMVTSPTTATAQLTIDPAAIEGPRDVTAATGGQQATLANGFNVLGVPTLLSLSPDAANQGQQNLGVNLTGQFTNWVQGTTTANFGAGITVASMTVKSLTSATAMLNVDPAAAAGARNVTVTTNAEVVTLNNGFTVNGGTPALTQVNPNTAQQGQQNLSVNLAGQLTHWMQGTSTASFGAGITVASLTVNSATTATAVLSIDSAAAIGARNVSLTTNTEMVALLNGFTIVTGTVLPPDPSTVAPPLNMSVATTIASATSFLYSGANPIQRGYGAHSNQERILETALYQFLEFQWDAVVAVAASK